MSAFSPVNIKKWTKPDHYAGASWPEYYSSGVGQSRDSDALERSNFASMLRLVGGESETVIVVRESHWAVGWVEWIAIHESDAAALQAADEAKGRLEDYPILDESDCADREQDEADHVWRECYRPAERVAYIRENRSQFEFHDWAEMRACVRGEFFAGYASELIYR